MLKVLLLLIALVTPNNESKTQQIALGEINLPQSSTLNRQKSELGFKFLHNFMYEHAENQFKKALPDPWAYLGLLVSQHKSVWQKTNFLKGMNITEEIQQKQLVHSNPNSPIAKLLSAYSNFYITKNNKQLTQDLKKIFIAFPDNSEAAALYGLSLLADAKELDKSRLVLKKAIKKWPNHPGLLHYYIHASDINDLNIVREALTSASHYADIATDASHGLHMPSHLYVRLGMWNKSIISNSKSQAASVSLCKKFSLNQMCDAENRLHAIEWLHYSYIQAKEDKLAIKLLENVKYLNKQFPSKEGERVLNIMLARSILHDLIPSTEILVTTDAELTYWQIYAKTSLLIAQGIKAGKNIEKAQKSLAQLKQLQKNNIKASSSMQAYMELGIEHIRSSIMFYNGDIENAINTLSTASILEDKISHIALGYLTTTEHLYAIFKKMNMQKQLSEIKNKRDNIREFLYN